MHQFNNIYWHKANNILCVLFKMYGSVKNSFMQKTNLIQFCDTYKLHFLQHIGIFFSKQKYNNII